MFLTPFCGISTINQNNFSIAAVSVSLLGAVILLAVLNFVRRCNCSPLPFPPLGERMVEGQRTIFVLPRTVPSLVGKG
jgi:hypothetical protein